LLKNYGISQFLQMGFTQFLPLILEFAQSLMHRPEVGDVFRDWLVSEAF
jgi:hypothetical protein